jgi:hypothetical protein
MTNPHLPARPPGFRAGPRLCLAGLLFLTAALPARAGTPAPAPAPTAVPRAATVSVAGAAVLADGWSVKGYFSGLGTRSRIIQFCAFVMCVALFIMMRKLE